MIRILSLALAVAGCSQTMAITENTPPSSAAPSTQEVKQAVRTYVRANFFDPYSIRDAELSEPTWQASGLQFGASGGWTVCLRANAKNRLGGYTGRKDTAMTIQNGKVTAALDDAQWNCSKERYAPFPELTQG
jgi:hypothetical protein